MKKPATGEAMLAVLKKVGLRAVLAFFVLIQAILTFDTTLT